jgi:5-oxoprolinase (ATP-hydrolysing) subunit C
MKGALHAITPGPLVTIQDAGRRGWRRFGVSGAGAMDGAALSAANALVGNAPGTAAVEFAHVGGSWQIAAESCRIALTGGDFAVSADGARLACWQSHTLRRGQRIDIGGAPDAVWGYLAVANGFALSPQLGSCATHQRSGLGGIGGCRLAEGDMLPLRSARAPYGRERRIQTIDCEPRPIRVVLGPQDDFFAEDAIATFLTASYRVTHRGDRMGVWLDGPAIRHAAGYNVLSDGVVPGCIQVPGIGKPLVLLMDCQTIGGYPKLATIITPDLPRLAQMKAGTTVSFVAIDVKEAQRLYREYRAQLDGIPQRITEIPESPARPFWLHG